MQRTATPADPTRSRHRQPSARLPSALVPAAADPDPARNSPPIPPVGAMQRATVEELLVVAQTNAHTTRELLDRLVALLDRRPAQLIPVTLQQATPIKRVPAGSARSFGVYNPSSVVIYSNVGGAIPAPGRGALSFPANSLVVLPVAAEADFQIGANPSDLAAGDISVWLLFFAQVQGGYMGAL
jgi:hypothetical protein